ncbi:imelysin family protein [Prevotella falsenii]|uniref:imelysin family protein n=1 Tax=Prevotella falsenii TaxID=515414 RepID=UPI0004690253|nr:imelysin family protein [Prevotella falsenii]
MKKIFNFTFVLAVAGTLALGFSSCSDKDDNTPEVKLSEGDQYLQNAIGTYVDNTVNPTYAAMAVAADQLYNKVKEIHAASKTKSVNQTMVNEACQYWKEARLRYEKSEAFLLGAAADYNIDPHIDTWPLDLAALHTLLSNTKQIQSYDAEDGVARANSDLGQTVLGFHGIEFILFRDGQPRKAEELNGFDTYNQNGQDFTKFSGEYELIYAEVVAGDLRNAIFQLEVCWNENAPKAHVDVLEAFEMKTHMPLSDTSYGWSVKHAGEAGSTFRSIKHAVSSILVGDGGCAAISDEVGQKKIGNPFTGEDVHYIESPYSYNSLTDFSDNIQSINNVWNGGVEEARGKYSFAEYFKKYEPTIGKEVQDAIDNAQAEIGKIKKPFALNYTDPQCKKAMEACAALSKALANADEFIAKNNK